MNKQPTKQGETKALRPFVHLHTHTEYSLSDGIAKIEALVDKAMADGMPGMAITDHANMFGICEFVECVNRKNRAKNGSFKPIIGCEVYVARRGMEQKSEREDFAGYHLVLLAKNYTGYQNLVKLVSRSWMEGYHGRPRTDKIDLMRYHEGLICSSACIGGEVAQHILNGHLDQAEAAALWYKELFGEDFYLELQRHKATAKVANRETYKLEEKVNEQLLILSHKHGIKVICTNDVHFVNEEDAEVQDSLLCINGQKQYDDPTRLVFSKQEWLKTTAEMNELFGDVPEALENTLEICNKVEIYPLCRCPQLPKATMPEGVDEVKHLARLAFDGAYKRYGQPLSAEVKELLKMELRWANGNHYSSLVLMWHEIVSAAQKLGVKMGPGMGWTRGSLLLYCLGITSVDPLQLGGAESKFFNHEHALPSIEIETDELGRDRVLQWVMARYGEESIANIAARSCFTPKTATWGGLQPQKLVGVLRKMDIHSCGLAICAGEISEQVPLAWVVSPKYEGATIVTQYGCEALRRIGIPVVYFLTSNKLNEVAKKETL